METSLSRLQTQVCKLAQENQKLKDRLMDEKTKNIYLTKKCKKLEKVLLENGNITIKKYTKSE